MRAAWWLRSSPVCRLWRWLTVEQIRDGRPTTFGAASGVVAGLVAIVGLAAGIVCSFAVAAKFRFGYDDSLDVVGVHFVGAVVGVLLIGLLATEVMTGGRKASSMAADSHSSASMRWAHLWSACTRSSCRTCWPR
jgi:Amt family ammonium transporter